MCYVSVCLSSAACLCKPQALHVSQPDLHISVSRCRKNSWHVLHCPSVHRPHMPSGCRLVLRPEQIALALAEQPSAQPLVSGDILQSPLTSPTESQPHSQPHRAAGLSTNHLPASRGPHRAPITDLQSLGQPKQPSLYSHGATLSPMQHARASVQQWGRPRTAVAATPSPAPSPDSMVICGPTWSFPVEAGSPAPLRRGSVDAPRPCSTLGASGLRRRLYAGSPCRARLAGQAPGLLIRRCSLRSAA